jgi:hypothetical protein
MTMTTTDEQVAIFCGGCGARDTLPVKQVTASLACRCGSTQLGLVGVDDMPHTAAPHGPGTGWGKAMPDPLQGWSEYPGPGPQSFPRSAPVADTTTCPVCHGAKYDLIDKGPCRECGGTGYITHPTDRGPVQNYDPGRPSPGGGAGWAGVTAGLTAEAQAKISGRPYRGPGISNEELISSTTPGYKTNPDSFTSRSPQVHTREDKDYDAPAGPYQMDQAACPSCGHAPTQLVKDKNEDAWWHCPNCGPLANIDARPQINPYSPPANFKPDRSMKTGGFLSRNRKTGRLLSMLATIHRANELDAAEAVEIARKTLIKYREGR